ncbi:hypothetical protein VB780_13890 [Leptolyngbya sp. CCNP1308]|uniref:hypothetical protein n=1 Tax=Leptolyngbya sp. CCNP1308 TaxID=3110255 RepID=UPI002B20DB8B|nr:hypothetical protein [Leptolyngbya sp. CCNP1308]MEA5449672.1 hypothetical protein [Leptolyngbya sp. CCNP1308]
MTQSSDRLDRMEALLATTIEGLARTEANLARTEKITESNARAIESWGSRIEEVQIDTEEATSSTRADLAVRIEDNAHNQGIDRVRFDQLHEEHSKRFTNLLEEARVDRQRSEQLHAEHSQRFDVFLAEARADRAEMRAAREANATEHRAFTQNIQTLLAEIARLWQRVAG